MHTRRNAKILPCILLVRPYVRLLLHSPAFIPRYRWNSPGLSRLQHGFSCQPRNLPFGHCHFCTIHGGISCVYHRVFFASSANAMDLDFQECNGSVLGNTTRNTSISLWSTLLHERAPFLIALLRCNRSPELSLLEVETHFVEFHGKVNFNTLVASTHLTKPRMPR